MCWVGKRWSWCVGRLGTRTIAILPRGTDEQTGTVVDSDQGDYYFAQATDLVERRVVEVAIHRVVVEQRTGLTSQPELKEI